MDHPGGHRDSGGRLQHIQRSEGRTGAVEKRCKCHYRSPGKEASLHSWEFVLPEKILETKMTKINHNKIFSV